MVVYDVTNDQSFDSCAKWLERVKAQKPTPELPLPGILTIHLHVFILMQSCEHNICMEQIFFFFTVGLRP